MKNFVFMLPWLRFFYANLAFVCSVFTFYLPDLWHTKFYIDGVNVIYSGNNFGFFIGSFETASFFFKPIFDFMKFLDVDVYNYWRFSGFDFYVINLIFGNVYIYIIYVLHCNKKIVLKVSELLFVFMSVLIMAPYMFSINKEYIVFTVLFVANFVFLKNEIIGCANIVLYLLVLIFLGVFFRAYFLIFAFLIFVNVFFVRNYRDAIIVYGIFSCTIIVAYSYLPLDLILKGRAYYLVEETASRIQYPFEDSNGVYFLINRVVTLFNLLFPFVLIKISFVYFPYVIFQLILSWYMILGLKSNKKSTLYFLSISLLSFTFVQTLFEPDYGSYFRHKLNIFPLIVLQFLMCCKYKEVFFRKIYHFRFY